METKPQKKKSSVWKWLSIGCLTALILGIGGCVAIICGVMGIMKSSEPFKDGMRYAKASPAVVASIGEPIEDGWFMQGNIQVQNDSGTANITIPISGPKGNGSVAVVGTKTGGKWSYQSVIFTSAADGSTADLLAGQ